MNASHTSYVKKDAKHTCVYGFSVVYNQMSHVDSVAHVSLHNGKETAIKITLDEADESGNTIQNIRVIVINEKEYLSTRDVIRYLIGKTIKTVVKEWNQVKHVLDANVMKHKFKGSGEVEQDVIERDVVGDLIDQFKDVARQKRAGLLADIRGDPRMTKEEILDMLDRMDKGYPNWMDLAMDPNRIKRAKWM